MTNERTEAKIEEMRLELMLDLYEAMQDPDAILNPPEPVTETPAEPLFYVDVPSHSKGTKRYHAGHLSAEPARNAAMLGHIVQRIATGAFESSEQFHAAMGMAHAIIDSFDSQVD